LKCGAGIVGFEGVEHAVAAGQDQLGLVVERLHVMQAGDPAFGGAAFGLHVNVSEMRDAKDAFRRCRRRGLVRERDAFDTRHADGRHAGNLQHIATRELFVTHA